MNLVERFEKCHDFLSKWSSFLDLEPIRKYPHSTPTSIHPWIEELMTKDKEELAQLGNSLSITSSYPEMNNLLDDIRTLINFPRLASDTSANELISKKIKKKKEHEVKQITTMLSTLDDINIIDIGGGAGDLSENLVHKKNRFSFCIDKDSTLQVSGKERISKNNPENLDKVEFRTFEFNENASVIQSSFYDKNLIIGLHCCGDLSSDLLSYFQKSQSEHLLSIGCCYQKLTHKYNLSKLAQGKGLKFTENAFNLAARSFTHQTTEQLEQRYKIRQYRYMLHCYLYSLGYKEFAATGPTKVSDYQQPFSEYAQKYAYERVSSPADAQLFFEQPKNKLVVDQIIHTDFFRVLFGRVIEAYIVLDRAIYLQENGYVVEIKEIFDRKLSPRNLAIWPSIREVRKF